MIEQHIATYREEADELLSELETSLLELEDTPEDMELIGRVFRAMHTIKGSGAMFGFDEIAAFTHEVETVFDLVRNGKMAVSKHLLNLTLRARDHIKTLLDSSADQNGVDRDEGAAIIDGLRHLVPPSVVDAPVDARHEVSGGEQPGDLQTWRIRFRPNPEVLLCGANPAGLLEELSALGSCHFVAHLDNVPSLEDLNPEHCYIYWDIILTSACGIDAIRDVFIFIEDDCDLKIDMVDDGGCTDSDDSYKKLGDILVERGDLSRAEMQKILGMQKRFGELAVAAGIVTPDKVESALVEQQHVKSVRQERAIQESAGSIRVPADKLDQLVNLVGEMVTVQARLSQVAAQQSNSDFISIAEEVERLTNELRDTALNIRMLPIGSTFSKFKRLVRDLSQELGKEIEMETEGADTELDKTVIERLNDPLVHLIRNSIDHGIEMPEVRSALGKPTQGTVHLGAIHSGDSVLITIRDDGAGLDRDAIRAKAVERGLISAAAELSDNEIYNLIFAPGFSTAARITSVSGRGVGMDVVKKAIESLRGTIDITSVKGLGSTITLKIPLTLAIIECLLVRIEDSYFVMPLAMVEECVELTREDIRNSHGRNLANVRGEIVPYILLREQFEIGQDRPDIEQIVIVRINGAKAGFVVDSVVGEHQTVIKTLGRMYRDVKGISGATILGDGTVALILDMGMLLRLAEMFEQSLSR
ncbi:chemotaxis protein CheA [Geobacter sp. SVR]|uniref:chemotaxis protein CheA n=1 Tax=Geobacter sp. SVR TaxID=2495594 RepID=UPI00143F04A2|nr:chemotaxis protein CheA [Geobacter sp. SVR]BCS53733.1 chemotaxis protein CheA [Geobacter sp. SVR]GCF85758.1 chemotaxis protein CheA [Geobacter sp. SVR]